MPPHGYLGRTSSGDRPVAPAHMNKFKGFTDTETFTQLPDTFFHHLLKEIDDAAELKVTLYLIWRVEHMESPFRALSKMDFTVKELGLSAEEIKDGLEK